MMGGPRTPIALLTLLLTVLTVQSANGARRPLPSGLETNKQVSEPRRFALVLGNARYEPIALQTAVSDANGMSEALRDLGFDVTYGEDLAKADMESRIAAFSAKLTQGSVALVYYAGHGIQVNGLNYLVPVDAKLHEPDYIAGELISLRTIFDAVRDKGTSFNIVMLDACRNNPFTDLLPDNDIAEAGWLPGLAQPTSAPPETLVAFATQPGCKTPDGSGEHSAYTFALLDSIREPGLPIERLLKRVLDAVYTDSRGDQIPWTNQSFRTDFYFRRAVMVKIEIADADDNCEVFINGSSVRSWTTHGRDSVEVPLTVGSNSVQLRVYNARNFRSLLLRIANGWSFKVTISSASFPAAIIFEGNEHEPVTNGPRHGKTFLVAHADLVVDRHTAEVQVLNADSSAWAH